MNKRVQSLLTLAVNKIVAAIKPKKPEPVAKKEYVPAVSLLAQQQIEKTEALKKQVELNNEKFQKVDDDYESILKEFKKIDNKVKEIHNSEKTITRPPTTSEILLDVRSKLKKICESKNTVNNKSIDYSWMANEYCRKEAEKGEILTPEHALLLDNLLDRNDQYTLLVMQIIMLAEKDDIKNKVFSLDWTLCSGNYLDDTLKFSREKMQEDCKQFYREKVKEKALLPKPKITKKKTYCGTRDVIGRFLD